MILQVYFDRQDHGGDSSAVRRQLKKVQQMSMSYGACAAVSSDGRVMTWGAPEFGGDSSRVSGGLCDVSTVCSTAAAFAAIRGDGSVVTWGDAAVWWGQPMCSIPAACLIWHQLAKEFTNHCETPTPKAEKPELHNRKRRALSPTSLNPQP